MLDDRGLKRSVREESEINVVVLGSTDGEVERLKCRQPPYDSARRHSSVRLLVASIVVVVEVVVVVVAAAGAAAIAIARIKALKRGK